MDKEIIEFNKKCAEALGWSHREYGFKDNDSMFHYYDHLEFHDSYDWAMLLVKAAFKKDMTWMLGAWHLALNFKRDDDGVICTPVEVASPHIISTAALKVLTA